MRVLVATTETQGDRPGDYSATLEGELVTVLVVECDAPDRCGCGRGFPGLASRRATTTACVVERPDLDADTVRDLVADSLDRDGWGRGLQPDEFDDLVDDHVALLAMVCGSFPVGTVVGRSGALVFARPVRRAA